MSLYQKIANNNEPIISINSKSIATFQITLPVMSLAKAKKAIPFALEDDLLDDINELEFLIFKTSQKTLWDVIVLSKKTIQTIKIQLKKETETIKNCIFDFMLLPINEKKINYFKQDDDIIFRLNENQGGRLNENLFLKLYSSEEIQLSETNTNTLTNLTLFLNDSFKDLKKWLQPWRLTAVLFASMILISTIYLSMTNYQLESRVLTQKQQNIKIFQTLFPSIKRIVDIEVQIKQQLKSLSTQQQNLNNDFLKQLSQLTKINNKTNTLIFKNKRLTIK